MHVRVVGWGLAAMAAGAVGIIVAEAVFFGLPSLPAVVVAALLVGTAAAWPIAARSNARPSPICADCGDPSGASLELRFCIRCGSRRIWHMEPY